MFEKSRYQVIAALVGATAMFASSAMAEDVTYKWINTASGELLWSDAANWENGAIPGSDKSVWCVIDFTDLASGAIVSNDYTTGIKTVGLKFAGDATDIWKFANGKSGSPFTFTNGLSYVEVVGGTLTSGFNFAPWGAKISKRGSGTWTVTSDTWNHNKLAVEEGTLELPKGGSFYQTDVALVGPNTTFKCTATGAPVCHLTATGAAGQKVLVEEGNTLYVNSGNSTSTVNLMLPEGVLTGGGKIAPINSSTMTVNAPAEAFTGTYKIMNGRTVVAGRMHEDVLCYYPFEGSSHADMVKDASSYGAANTLKSWNEPPVVQDPERGTVVKFKKVGEKAFQYMSQAGFAGLPSGNENFTVGLWLRVAVDADATFGDTESIYGFGKNAKGEGSFLRIQRDGVGGGYLMYTNYGNNMYFGGAETMDGSWHHVAAVNGDKGKVEIYLDGEKVAENTALAARDIDPTRPFEIGFAGNSIGNWTYFNGCVDDFIIVRGIADPKVLMNLRGRNLASLQEAVAIDPSVKVEGALAGTLDLADGRHTIAGLASTSPFSEVRLADDLTVSRATGTDVYRARLTGEGKLVKDGAFRLTVAAPLEHTGGTSVKGGELSLCGAGGRKGVISEWTFEDESEIGRETTGWGFALQPTAATGAAIVTDGERGKVLELTGAALSSSGYSSSFPRGNAPFTLAMWVKTQSTGNEGVISWGTVRSNEMTMIRLDPTHGLMVTHLDSNWNVGGKAKIADGSWHHVVYSYANRKRMMYVDGEKAGETELSGDLNVTLSQPFVLGFNSVGKTYFPGRMDDVRVYNYALSETEIKADYAGYPAETHDVGFTTLPEPVLKYDFEDPDNLGKDVSSSGGGNLVTAGEVRSVVDPARGGRVLDLTAARGYLTAETFPGKAPQGDKLIAASITAWIKAKPTTCGKTKQWGGIVDFGGSSGFTCLAIYNEHRKAVTGAALSWLISRSTFLDAIGLEQAEKWHHVALTREKDGSGNLKVYLDGTPVGTYAGCQWYKLGTDFFYIGRTHHNETDWFDGYVDDVAVYDVTLSDEQVAELCLAACGRQKVDNCLPEGSDLEIAEGACVKVLGSRERIGRLTGAGMVQVSSNAKLSVTDPKGFTGSILNLGEVALAEGVEIDGAFADGYLAGVTGTVTIPETGRVAFDCKGSEVKPGRYVIARATAIVAPQSLAGWTATVKSGQLRYKFAVEDNAFILRVRPVGLALLVR